MKKILVISICLCTLFLPGFTSKDADLNKAAEVTQAYIDAIINSDIDTMLKLSTKENRGTFEEDKLAEDPFFKVILAFLKKAEFKIVDMEKYDGNSAEATITMRLPNVDAVLNDASAKVYAEYGENISEDEMFTHILPLLPAMLDDRKYTGYTEEEMDLQLTKENGQWKVDESFN